MVIFAARYPPDSFAKRHGLLTMRSLIAGKPMLYYHNRPVMSDGDVRTIKGLYQCR